MFGDGEPIFHDVNLGEPDFKAAFQAQLGANPEMVQFFLLPGAIMELEAGKQKEVLLTRSNVIFGEDPKLLVG